ncbi:cellulase family glycosylhydrolase [Algoriphagus sp. D3-2-R+10]|uniref:cellulase family glycosylhydrolase n=1 Tax=Algoriphagus aurantiacus TaxID=3103948 RepID=UPI002B3848BF|nr:cellulase family glycosylhydrolase [Algoriphagus sp. D3-2-R+10]MEB2776000.1 cellulase family glycosylhydrolase [Algoriphagus sp. D3-2-R+10]
MNNPFRFLVLLFFVSMVFFSCGEDEDPFQLVVSSNSLEFGANEETQILTITSNQSWTIDIDSAWGRATPKAGSGNAQISITLDSNDAEEVRTTKLNIRAGTIVQPVTLKQEAKVPIFPDYFIPADNTGMRDIPSLDLASEMGIGWNLGNSLEAIGSETAWGNPLVTKELIDAVKAAGFNAIRIPVAWSKFSDETTYEIDAAWMARVNEVVDYVIDNDMYAVMNIHWDEGWMQPTFSQQDYVNDRLEKMWIQIALNFRDYDDHLLFAGTNEVMVDGDYGTPKPEYYQVQNSFNQTFVDAVRSTGGRNTYRNLVVQSFNTNIDHGVNFFEMPDDSIEDRLMVEVHYYDPYEFALREDEVITQWGKDATDPSKTASWGGESHADGQFQKMKTKFKDHGVAVILGEYGAVDKKAEGNDSYREDYLRYITTSAKEHGLVPFYWDNGYGGDYGFALVDRNSGSQLYPDLIKAITD